MIGGIALMAARAAAHFYQDCWDPDCMMFGCRAYKTGFRDGYDQGKAAGRAEGYAAGLADGMAAAGAK